MTHSTRLFRVLAAGSVLAGGLFLFTAMLDAMLVPVLYHMFMEDLGAAVLMNPHAIKVFAAGMALLCGVGIARLSGQADLLGGRAGRWACGILGVTTLSHLLLWGLTREENFDAEGRHLRYYEFVPDGNGGHAVRYQFRGPKSTRTGRSVKAVTPEIWPLLEVARAEGGLKQVDPVKRDWMTPDGLAALWYTTRDDGEMEFWNAPGYHPGLMVELQPVSPGMRREWLARLTAEKAAKDAAGRKAAAAEEAKRHQEAQEAGVKAEQTRAAAVHAEKEKSAAREARERREKEEARREMIAVAETIKRQEQQRAAEEKQQREADARRQWQEQSAREAKTARDATHRKMRHQRMLRDADILARQGYRRPEYGFDPVSGLWVHINTNREMSADFTLANRQTGRERNIHVDYSGRFPRVIHR